MVVRIECRDSTRPGFTMKHSVSKYTAGSQLEKTHAGSWTLYVYLYLYMLYSLTYLKRQPLLFLHTHTYIYIHTHAP